MAKRVVKYTEPILIRLSKVTITQLETECAKLEIDEAVYGRKAIKLCLKKHLINDKQGSSNE